VWIKIVASYNVGVIFQRQFPIEVSGLSGLDSNWWFLPARTPERCAKVLQGRFNLILVAVLTAALLLLSACTTQQGTQKPVAKRPAPDSSQIIVNVPTDLKDSGPAEDMDVSHIPDAVPRREVRTIAGNKSPYEVLGKTYRVLEQDHGFKEEGLASWYGNKFHGKRTANGELYSMYAMSGAHKTLPIPSYVKVTNLDNGREVIVRVNDRGPFHQGRVIDLSYAAASKLGFVKHGTAPVRLEAIQPQDDVAVSPAAASRTAEMLAASSSATKPSLTKPAPSKQPASNQPLPNNAFLQAGAFSSSAAAENLRRQLGQLTSLPVKVVPPSADSLYRVHVGPIDDNMVLADLRVALERNQLPAAYLVYD
jgi:rare lipoprotein A